METQGHFLSLGDTDLYYEVSGNSNGKPLILLHGGLGCLNDLDRLLNYIPSEFHLIRVDFRGHGRSALGSAQLSYALYQQDIERLIQHLNLDQFSFFGFSDGGITAYRIAAHLSNRVDKLVTLGAQWRLTEDDPSIEILQNLTTDFWLEKFPEEVALYKQLNPNPNLAQLIESVKHAWLDTSESGYPAHNICKIKCPTLIMRGDKDFLFSLSEAEQLIAQLPQTQFLNIPFCEHEAHKEYPELVGVVLSRFLKDF